MSTVHAKRIARVVGALQDARVHVKWWDTRIPPAICLRDNATAGIAKRAAKIAHTIYPHEICFYSWQRCCWTYAPKRGKR